MDKLTATERSPLGSLEQRTEIASQGMRGLFLINGGGAVALLAFLQSAWTNTPALVPYVASGIVALMLGLVFAAAVPFVRIAASLHYQTENFNRARRYSFWHRLLEKLAIAAFIGILVVVTGVFANLPAVGQQSPNNRLDPDARKTRAAQPERFSSQ
ncbi:MAG: hypothetical protein K0Q83_2452 [Deltaproteobacteria bacterium]|nr:hypothetical protein [Deltaproteobacteria bacterium]